jgi:surfeit locus 1 family protein
MSNRPMLWPTLATLAGLAILLGLGTWQVQRLQWKEALIAQLATRAHAAPVKLEIALADAVSGADVEYTHVTARGQFRHDLERFVYVPGDGDWGYHVITPLDLGAGRAILINRGYIPRQLLDPAKRSAGQPGAQVEVTGLLRRPPPARPWYIPAGDLKSNTWSWPEMGGIAQSMYGASGAALPSLFIDADAGKAGSVPAGGATRMELSNRHLEYAITWYALAATLAGIYAFAWVRHLRAQRG